MLEIIFTLVFGLTAYRVGTLRAVNQDIVKQTEHMQHLIDQAYQKRDALKDLWIDAEDRAKAWEKHYWDLVEKGTEEDGS